VLERRPRTAEEQVELHHRPIMQRVHGVRRSHAVRQSSESRFTGATLPRVYGQAQAFAARVDVEEAASAAQRASGSRMAVREKSSHAARLGEVRARARDRRARVLPRTRPRKTARSASFDGGVGGGGAASSPPAQRAWKWTRKPSRVASARSPST